MSKRINVNPGQYKVAGRERPGGDVPEPERSPGVHRNDEAARERWERKQEEKNADSAKEE